MRVVLDCVLCVFWFGVVVCGVMCVFVGCLCLVCLIVVLRRLYSNCVYTYCM